MISERKKVAAEYRSEGEGEKADILGQMRKELKQIESEAYQKAVQIKGQADARAASIYAEAFNQEPKFYNFIRSLDAYEKAVGSNNSLILSTETEFYNFFNRIDLE
jgi:membrane protease subunit HflC